MQPSRATDIKSADGRHCEDAHKLIPTHDLLICLESLLTALMLAGCKISTKTEWGYHQADLMCFIIVRFTV